MNYCTRTISPFILFSICLSFSIKAQNPDWRWAREGTGHGSGEGYGTACDHKCNVIITGSYYSADIAFGPYILHNDSIGNTGDIYIAKYDSSGQILWAREAGGKGNDEAYSVAADNLSNLYIAGSFHSPFITFGSDTLFNDTTNYTSDIFIAKYDYFGNFLWARKAGGKNDDEAYGVAVDSNGNAYITGYFSSHSAQFAATTLYNTSVVPLDTSSDIFLAKYSPVGNLLWAISVRGNGEDTAHSIALTRGNTVYITGNYSSHELVFLYDTLMNSSINPIGVQDVFLAKFSSEGNEVWARRVIGQPLFGFTDSKNSISVAADSGRFEYIAGYFYSPWMIFGVDDTFTYPLTDTFSFSNVFLAKYDAAGNFIWAKLAGKFRQDKAFALSVDVKHNVFLTGGSFSHDIVFDADSLVPPVTTCASGCDPMFVIKYTTDGDIICATEVASGGDDGIGLATDLKGNAYIGGDFKAFNFVLGQDTLIIPGLVEEQIFVAKYNCSVPPDTMHTSVETIIPGSCVVFPDPASDQLNMIDSKSEKIEFYDLLGRTLGSSHVSASVKTTIDIHTFPRVFLVKMESGDVKKVIRL